MAKILLWMLPVAPMALAYKSGSRGRIFRKELSLPPLEITKSSALMNNYGDALPVLYTNDPAAARQWAKRHFVDNRPTVIGWDMESSPNVPWRETLYEGPATVQISVVDAALVLQIAQEDTGPCLDLVPFLSDILSDPSILKTGVGIDQDMMELMKWPAENNNNGSVLWQDMVGRLDLGGIGGRPGTTQSLKTLGEIFCGVDLVKDKKLARSNWARAPRISMRQIAYAARDAWVASAVLEELARRDPRQFSTPALVERVLKEEISIHVLLERAAARKVTKGKLQSLLGVGDDRIDRKSLPKDQLEVLLDLEQEFRELAPPRPLVFDLEPLGL